MIFTGWPGAEEKGKKDRQPAKGVKNNRQQLANSNVNPFFNSIVGSGSNQRIGGLGPEAVDNMFVVFKTESQQSKADNQEGGIAGRIFKTKENRKNQTGKIGKDNIVMAKKQIKGVNDIKVKVSGRRHKS